ncbi:haloalkane dehalogenase [Sphingomonas sp. UYAg733]
MNRRNFFGLSAGALACAALARPALAERSIDRFRVPEWGLNRRFLRNGFGRIAYVDEGGGDPALFLHGFPLSGFQWRASVEQLGLFYRCIVPDFMGLGATEAAEGQDLAAPAQMAMLVALLDALKVNRVHVVASDSGGAVAQLLVAHHPERVRTLLLTNCDTERQSPPPAMRPVIDLARKGLYVKQWLEPWYESRDHARAPDQFGGMCYADPRNPTDEAIEMYFGPLLSSPERARQVEELAIAQSRNVLTGIGPALKRSLIPTRIVWGSADTIFEPANADFLDQSFGNSRGVRRLEKSKLFWPEECPDVIAEEANALWRQAGA